MLSTHRPPEEDYLQLLQRTESHARAWQAVHPAYHAGKGSVLLAEAAAGVRQVVEEAVVGVAARLEKYGADEVQVAVEVKFAVGGDG